MPFHDNVPSFGEWGWWIGGRDTFYSETKLKHALSDTPNLTRHTKYLTSELTRASLHFGKNQLETDQQSVNTITNPCIYNYYLEAWKGSQSTL